MSPSDRPEARVDEDDDDPFANMSPARSTKRRRVDPAERPKYGTAPPTFVEESAFDSDDEVFTHKLKPRRDDSMTRLQLAAAMPDPEPPEHSSSPGVSPTVPLTPNELAVVHAKETQAKPRPRKPSANRPVGTMPESVSSFGNRADEIDVPADYAPTAPSAALEGKQRRAAREESERAVARTKYALQPVRLDGEAVLDAPAAKRRPGPHATAHPSTRHGALPGWAWFMAGVVVGTGLGIAFMLALVG